MVPRLGLRKSSSREFGESLLLATRIKPALPPALGGVDCLQAEVSRIAADLDPAAANWVGAATSSVWSYHEDRLPQSPAGRNSKEAFT